ncbi:MAG: hypothetical protein NTW05_11925, partial [Pseudonocardiales bacterium]|nr:hypothetical protein [Pseudonocardiales bacterium]
MAAIDPEAVLLTCAGDGQARRLPFHGRRRVPELDGVPTVAVPARPGRADLDPVLAGGPRRVVVHGADSDLAAVVLRLLRSERLDVEVAYVPAGRSAVAALFGLPSGRAAHALALAGRAQPVPLVRDDTGGVLVGRAEVRGLVGECFCDDTLVLRGPTPRLVVAARPDGIAVRAGRGGGLPDGATRAVPLTARAGRGSARGRAVQLGGLPFTPVADGVALPRPLERRTRYRHTDD